MRKWLHSNLALLIACLMLAAWALPSRAACQQTLDRLPGQNSYTGSWVFVCQGAGIDYVKRTRRLITWRSPNPRPDGSFEVRFLNVERILGQGVNWLSVTVLPSLNRGIQDPETLDIKQAMTMAADAQPPTDLPDIAFPPGAGANAHDRLLCAGVWRVPEGGVRARIAMRLYADGRHEARFRGLLLRKGTRTGLSFSFADAARITLRGTARLHPDGQGGWQVSCRFEVVEPDYYGKDRHRRSHFAGRVGEFTRHHCQLGGLYC